ncbi:hypothetical protein R5W23_001583 [Gemmata sp. JC673]|uniref:Lipoprotein n=1 Tax=Gemmata algarum TaxID=2975278 RepID=A0ABU5EYG3_9BACT|nr:hypothetical protein [Gemmata algarum]MDY3560350.1 hypothetical protein [Gemmata algarum]
MVAPTRMFLLAAALLGAAAGCTTSTDATPRRVGDALRPAAAPVPPTQEIEILDPNVDPTGKPVARVAPLATSPSVECAPVLPASAVQQQVEVPPAILVHKFYYTGDRSFQGPMIPGGPLIVSVNHPKTLERVYVPITLPPGAPRVTYTNDTIRYDYGPQSVSLVFGVCGNPRVRYSQATNVHENTRTRISTARTETRDFVTRTGIPSGLQRFKDTTKSTLGAVADRVHDGGKFVADAVTTAIEFIPGAQLLKSNPEDQAIREQERLQRDADRRPNLDNTFVPRAP